MTEEEIREEYQGARRGLFLSGQWELAKLQQQLKADIIDAKRIGIETGFVILSERFA